MKPTNLLLATNRLLVTLFLLPASFVDAKIENVVFIISDDLRANVLSCYGNDICSTPNIDRLAKSGLLFQSAYCQATWCAPSRQSLMFSRYVDKRGHNTAHTAFANKRYEIAHTIERHDGYIRQPPRVIAQSLIEVSTAATP